MGAGSAKQDDSDVIDLDAMATSRTGKNTLKIEIDEPRGRPAESTLHSKAQSSEALEVVLGELETLRKAYNALMEDTIKDHEDAQQKVHVAHLAINEVLEERKSDVAEIRSLVAEIDQVAHRPRQEASRPRRCPPASQRLRDSLQESDVAQMVQFAEGGAAPHRRAVRQPLRARRRRGRGEPLRHFRRHRHQARRHRGGQARARRRPRRPARAARAPGARAGRGARAPAERHHHARGRAHLARPGPGRAARADHRDLPPRLRDRPAVDVARPLWPGAGAVEAAGGAGPGHRRPRPWPRWPTSCSRALLQTLTERALNAPETSVAGSIEGGHPAPPRRRACLQELSAVRAELLQSRTDLSRPAPAQPAARGGEGGSSACSTTVVLDRREGAAARPRRASSACARP